MIAIRTFIAATILVLVAGTSFADDAFITAGVHWPGGKAQFFLNDGTYIRYDVAADRADPGYPKPIDDGTWPGLGSYAKQIMATCNGPSGKIYFFLSSGQYIRYDIKQDHVDSGYPMPIDDETWPGLKAYAKKIWVALNWTGGKIQFFLNDGTYIRYDVAADHVDPGYPKPINSGTWPGVAPYAKRLLSAINWDNNKVYMFLNNGTYLRYDIENDSVDSGYPMVINDKTWPGMGAVFGAR
jgi:hypothetical protein